MKTGIRRACVGAIVLAITIVGSTSPAVADVSSPQLQQAVENWAAEIGAPGMTAQIVDTDGVTAEASTGVDGRGDDVASDTPFVWGSVSKQLAAATVVALERDGLVDPSASVLDIVPQARGMVGDRSVTIDDLVHHTSGLPHDITVTDDWTRRVSASDAAASIDAPDDVAARGQFRYSSLNYLLLQAVIEQSTGGTYADALNREVLEPAGATGTITDPDDYTRQIAPGHVPFFGQAKSIDVGVDSAGLGYGYLAGSISDLGRYASWRLGQLQDGEGAAGEVDTRQGTTYGNGLFHEDISGQQVWWHSGAVPGYYTYVALVPDTNQAIVLATNRYGEIEAERIAAVGRNLTTMVLDGSTTELPGSLAFTVLGIAFALAALLLVAVAWMVYRLATGRARPRTRTGAIVRIIVTVVVAGAVLFGAFIGVPLIAGAPLSVMWLWAPDAAVAFWVLVGAVALTAVVVIAGQVVGSKAWHRVTPSA